MVLQAEIIYTLFETEISLHLFQGIFASLPVLVNLPSICLKEIKDLKFVLWLSFTVMRRCRVLSDLIKNN